MRQRTFAEYVVPKPKTRLMDVVTTLRDFALVTYTIDADRLRAQLPPGLSPLTVDVDGRSRALLSVVLFMNSDFRSAVLPVPRFTMPQINYRAYVVDERTGEHGIWFLATLIDAWAYAVPRLLWKMPWRKGPIDLRSERDEHTGLYTSYRVTSRSDRAPAEVELTQRRPTSDIELPGFPDVETGLVCLTHAAKGFFRRSDGKIGVNRVWHKRIPVAPARLLHASFPLLERLQLVSLSEQRTPYSVLLAPEIGFVSHLPPQIVR